MNSIKLLDDKDIDALSRTRSSLFANIITHATIGSAGSYVVFKGLTHMLYFRNPLHIESDFTVSSLLKRGRHILVPVAFTFVFLTSFCANVLQYEAMKIRHYNKYKQLVHNYGQFKIRRIFDEYHNTVAGDEEE